MIAVRRNYALESSIQSSVAQTLTLHMLAATQQNSMTYTDCHS